MTFHNSLLILFFQTLEPNTPQKGKDATKKKKKQFGKKSK